MRIRRITLAILLLLTLLMVFDVRYFGGEINKGSVSLDISPTTKKLAFEREEQFSQAQGNFTSLILKGQFSIIELKSVEGDEISVLAVISAENEELLDRLNVKESVSGSELSYELLDINKSDGKQDRGLGFIVEVPAGMEVSVEQSFGSVKINDFVGFLDLVTSFSNSKINDLEGTVIIKNSFGTLDMCNIAGPLTLIDSFSTSKIELVPISEGYDFDFEVLNGSLKHNLGFKVDVEPNRVTAREKWGNGIHPVEIKSSFGTVTINIED